MVSLVADARDLPPDMILLPGGREMRLSEFWLEHGDDLRPYAGAEIAVATRSLHVPAGVERAEVAVVGLVVAAIVGFLLKKSPGAAKVAVPVAVAYVATDAVDWINHHIEHGRIVRVYTLGELFPSLDAQRARLQEHQAAHEPDRCRHVQAGVRC